MVERRRFVFGAFVFALLVAFGWLVLRPHEPAYKGQPLSVCLLSAYQSGSDELTRGSPEAIAAVSAVGSNAVPVLLSMLSTRNHVTRRFLDHLGRAAPFLHLPLQDGRNEMAVWAFRVLGTQAKGAVPDLIHLLEDRDPVVRICAARSLAGLGCAAQDAIPVLLDIVRRPAGTGWQDAGLRDAAASALGEMGTAAILALPDLLALTNVPSAELAALRIQGGPFFSFIERLRSTSDRGGWIRIARLVSELGTNGAPAVPLLLAALDETNRTVRLSNVQIQETALEALARLHQRPDLCLPALVTFLDSPEPNTRYRALLALRAFGPEAKSVAPDILRCAKNSIQWFWIAQAATNALLAIDREAITHKQQALDDP